MIFLKILMFLFFMTIKIVRGKRGVCMSARKLDFIDRKEPRKCIEKIGIQEVTSLYDKSVIAQYGVLLNISLTAFCIHISRCDLVRVDLRQRLSLDNLIGEHLNLFLPDMNLNLDGIVIRSSRVDQKIFELVLKFSSKTPLYWRQCFLDLIA